MHAEMGFGSGVSNAETGSRRGEFMSWRDRDLLARGGGGGHRDSSSEVSKLSVEDSVLGVSGA
jgi:hypothetical protein